MEVSRYFNFQCCVNSKAVRVVVEPDGLHCYSPRSKNIPFVKRLDQTRGHNKWTRVFLSSGRLLVALPNCVEIQTILFIYQIIDM